MMHKISYPQERIWFFEELLEDSPIYLIYSLSKVVGEISVPYLERAINELIKRHLLLRVTFHKSADGVNQILKESYSYKIPVKNVEFMEEIVDLAKQTFDLSELPLFRVEIIKKRNDVFILFCMHHIISDGWSLGILESELWSLYNAYLNNREIKLPKIEYTYMDYVKENLTLNDINKNKLKYWIKKLSGVDYKEYIPRDFLALDNFNLKSEKVFFSLDEDILKSISLLSARNKTTLFSVFFSIFNLVLSKISRDNDIVVAIMSSNREDPRLKNVVGFFVNTLLIRVISYPEYSFKDLLNECKRSIYEAQSNQSLPFDQVVKSIRKDFTSKISSSLFQCAFVYQNTPREDVKISGARLSDEKIDLGDSPFEILMSMTKVRSEIEGFISYSSQVFSRKTIENIVSLYRCILDQIMENETLLLKDIRTFNKLYPFSMLPKKKEIHVSDNESLVTEWAKSFAANPYNVALIYRGESFTYKWLDDVSSQFASYLAFNGVSPKTGIGIHLNSTNNAIALILGILKAGCFYIPMDKEYPKERLNYIVSDANLSVVISDDIESFDRVSTTIWWIDFNFLIEAIQFNENTLDTAVMYKDDLAYVIYTSGTTGRPKGVKVSHKNVIRLFKSSSLVFDFSSEDTWVLFHSLAFDFSVWEMFGALLNGSKLLIIDRKTSRRSDEVVSILNKFKVTILNQTPLAFKQMISIAGDNDKDVFTNLRYVIFGGDALRPDVLALWFKKYKYSDTQLVNMYGITETTVHVSYHFIKESDVNRAKSVIGVPLPDLSIILRDPFGNPVSPGVPGEIYISGAGVSKGYLGKNLLTQERFIDFQPISYKTGDLAYLDGNGDLIYVGRSDRQVKYRGFRIELSSIEHHLKQELSIDDAFVDLLQGDDDSQQLIAYVVLSKNSSLKTQWTDIFDETYSKKGKPSKFNNFSGWNSLYTGEAISEKEMKSWIHETKCSLPNIRDKNVLEIGFGTGMILYRIIEDVSSYVGTDISEIALNSISVSDNDKEKIKLFKSEAIELDSLGIEPKDVVIVNSVIQYFPSIDYLMSVIKQIFKSLSSQAVLFIGDVRSLELSECLYEDIERYKNPDFSTMDIINAIKTKKESEHELLISPEFFYTLKSYFPEISGVEVMMKKGLFDNELTCFRYDVRIHIGTFVLDSNEVPNLYWKSKESFEKLESILKENRSDRLYIKNIPNKRLIKFLSKKEGGMSAHPMDLVQLSDHYNYKSTIYVNYNNEYMFNIFLTRHDDIFNPEYNKESHDYFSYSNNPVVHTIDDVVPKSALDSLQKKLPSYMVPEKFVVLNKIPLTVNGKIDRSSLPSTVIKRPDIKTSFYPPQSDTEKRVVSLFEMVLNLKGVGVDDSFFDLGGHSLLATKLTLKIKEAFYLDIPLKFLFENPTARSVSEFIDGNFCESMPFDDLDCMYNDSLIKIPENRSILNKKNETTYVLLTGSTGFLGSFLLDSLIKNTSFHVICLVRSSSLKNAEKKLIENLRRYKIDIPIDKRVSVLVGDLEDEKLGLSDNHWNRLAYDVSIIVHCASMVNFVAPYASHKPANVDGTLRLLDLASFGVKKSIHYVSTTHVLTPDEASPEGVLFEASLPDYPGKIPMGYTKSKWVSESILKRASEKGYSVSIYRPGRIWGDLKNGCCQINDYLWLMLKMSSRIGLYPNTSAKVDALPVDIVSSRIVSILKLKNKNENDMYSVYHLVNSNPVRWNEICSNLNSLGLTMNPTTLREWKNSSLSWLSSNPESSLNKVLSLIDEISENSFDDYLVVDCINARKLLSHNYTDPKIDRRILSLYLSYFNDLGFM